MPAPDAIDNPYRELAKRFFITFILAVVVYRLGIAVPIPGINAEALADHFSGDDGLLGQVWKMVNMFNGGALVNGSIFGLGIMPYISASIIMQLLAYSVPALKALQKEGEVGRRKINQYTRYVTLGICFAQSIVAAVGIYQFKDGAFIAEGMSMTYFLVQACLCITTGSMILLWLAEQVTKFGVGNGVSVVIMVGILASFPNAVGEILTNVNQEYQLPLFLGLTLVFLAIVACMVALTLARRIINLEQQRRIQGGRQYGGGSTKLPLMLNHSGVIPVIFAQPIMAILAFALGNQLFGLGRLFEMDSPGYRYIFTALIIFFTFFYISITIDLNEWANNFKQGGFFIRGVKPGKNTADFLRHRMTRLTFVGATTLAVITIFPTILGTMIGLTNMAAQTILGGIGLLIVVGVSLDVIQKVSSFLLANQYQGLMNQGGGGGGGGGGKGTKTTGVKRF